MKREQEIGEQLNRLPVPEKLEQQLHDNWHQQTAQKSKTKLHYRMPAAAILSGLFILVLVFGDVWKTPNIVIAAFNDIENDQRRNIGISVPVNIITNRHGITLPPKEMPIRLIKYCNINGNKAIHMQVNGENQGEVHLFINTDEFDTTFWQANEGEVNTMPWRLFKPKQGGAVLVLYTQDMAPDKVERLIREMFYV